MKHFFCFGLLLSGITILLGCSTTYQVDSVSTANEGSIVCVRPEHYSILSTESIRDSLEITYERLTYLPNGNARVEVGLRNRGRQHWWNSSGKDIQLSVTAKFYDRPVTAPNSNNQRHFPSDWSKSHGGGSGPNLPPLYDAGRKYVRIMLGETVDLSFDCPFVNASGYQLIISNK